MTRAAETDCRAWEKLHPFDPSRLRHAKAVLLIGIVLALLGSTADAQTYRVAGIVVSDGDGQALGRTRVSLAEVTDRRKAESVITAADGRFEFRNVPAGKFSLEGGRRDFMLTPYQWHEGFSTAIVTGAGVDTENLVLRLIPLGSIAGKVIDEAGEPVRNANVKLSMHRDRLGEDRIFPRGFAQTDDEGKYEFRDLMPAEYFVSVTAKPWYAVRPVWENENGVRKRTDTVAPELNVAYPRTYYNGATDQAEATPLIIRKGERLTADLHLNPTPALTVIVKGPMEPGQNSWSAPILRKMDMDRPEEVVAEMSPTGTAGEMMISGLAPGRYAISSAPPDGGMVRQTGQVDISEDGQVVEPKPQVDATATVKVRLKMWRGEELQQDLSFSLRDEHRRTIAFAEATAKGDVTFEHVPAGRYAVMVNFNGPQPYTIGKMRIGGVEVEGHDITVGDASTLEIDATLMAGVVSVEGVVKSKDGKPVGGAMVALIPRGMEAQTHFERIRWDQSDLDGTFTVRQILPGKYTLIAVEDAWGTAWLKQGVLAKYLPHGQELTIGELMTQPVVLPEPLEALKK